MKRLISLIVAVMAAFLGSVPLSLAACSNACSSSQYTCSLGTTSMSTGTSGTLEASVTNQQSQSQTSVIATLLGSWFTGSTTTVSIPSISSGESKSLSFTITPNTAGSQDVCVSLGTCTADCTQVTVTSSADLNIVSLTPSSSSVSTSASFTVSATIQNAGTENAGSTTGVTATLSSSSGCTVSSASRSIGTIAGSSSSSQSWSVTAGSSAATCTLTLSVSGTPGGSESSTTSVTVSAASTPTPTSAGAGTGSGGGGGAGNTPTPTPFPKVKKSFDIASIAAGAKAEVTTATLKDVNLKKIEITAVNAVSNIKLDVTKIASSDKPSSVTTPSNTVYHYIQIDKINLTDADVSSAKLEFQVEKSWITGNNIDESKVTLNRFANNAWSALTTTKTGEDATYAFYQADSPGLSVFAITAKEKPAPTPTTAAPVPTAGATATPVPTAASKPAGGVDTTVIVIVLVVIAGAAYYYRDKLKKALKMS